MFFLLVFLAKFWRFFTFYNVLYKTLDKAKIITFFSPFFIEFKRFFIDQVSSFFPRFFIKFSRFFYQLNIRFIAQFSTRVKRFFFTKVMISNAICLSKVTSKRKSNYNIMKLHNKLCYGSNLSGIISYHYSSWGILFINHLSLDLLNLFD